MMRPNIWSDSHGTVYLRWGDRGPYRWITESGETGERFTLPAGVRVPERSRWVWDLSAADWSVA